MKKNITIVLLVFAVGFLLYADYWVAHGDLNHDGKIDVQDLSILLRNYNK